MLFYSIKYKYHQFYIMDTIFNIGIILQYFLLLVQRL